MNKSTLWVRKEIAFNEYRTPIIPEDIEILLELGIEVIVESSSARCCSDEEYKAHGAKITKNSFSNAPPDSYILGLKELPVYSNYPHRHIYFSHLLKNQIDHHNVLKKFKNSNGVILDYEFLLDANSERVVTFSYHAGKCAAYASILLWNAIREDNLKLKLQDYLTEQNLLKMLSDIFTNNKYCPHVLVIGSNGKAGKYAVTTLKKFNISVDEFSKPIHEKQSDITSLVSNYNIVINCIATDNKAFTVFDSRSLLSPYTVNLIFDVTCEPYGSFNPIPEHKKYNSLDKPLSQLYDGKKPIYISSIGNLANMMSYESSKYFSTKLTPYLVDLFNKGIENSIWQKPYKAFKDYEIIK